MKLSMREDGIQNSGEYRWRGMFRLKVKRGVDCMAESKPVNTGDIRGAACGMSVAKANLAIKGLAEGQVWELLAE